MQNHIRLRLIAYLQNSGVKQNYIAEQTGIPSCVLSRFKNNQKSLLQVSLDNLDQFLTSKGF